MKVTIKEVAKYANVSPSTVSRVLKNSPMISQSTKDKVNEAIEKLGYYPNEIAQSLANKSSHTLGIILPASIQNSFVNPFFTQFILGVTRCIQKREYSLLLSSAKDEGDELKHISRMVQSRRVDGIILLTVREQDKNIQYLEKTNFPFVVVGSPQDKRQMLWVDNDNEKSMYEVVVYMIEQGRKKIAFLGGDKKLKVTQDRLAGYARALEKYGIRIDERLIIEGDFSEAAGYTMTKELIQREEHIDAIVTTDDLIAHGSMKAIGDLRLRIPQDIAITGFNNTILSQYTSPTMTSVEINASHLGFYAAKILIDYINKQGAIVGENYHLVNTKLIKRNSTE